jgi:uncharacterized protein
LIEPSPHPTAPADRLHAIDALRGLALFGVMAINLVFEFRVSFFQQFIPKPAAASALDRAVENFLVVAVELKALILFSILFGVGLAIQFERLSRHESRAVLLIRRLAALLAVGLIHLLLIWNGDILTEYALAGFVVLPFLWAPRWLLLAASLCFFAFYVTFPPILPWPTDFAWMQQNVAEANRVYATGSFGDVLAFRLHEIPAFIPVHVAILPRTIALFLFGAFIWRTGILNRADKDAAIWFTFGAMGIAIGLSWTLLGRGLDPPVILACGYGAVVIGAMTTSAWRRLLGWAAPLGRMAFTNYLLHSIIFGWVFYGYGLGLFGQVGAGAALSFGSAVYAAQAVFSAWWLRHHRFGPVEWLWRSLTYGAPQVMRAVPSAG